MIASGLLLLFVHVTWTLCGWSLHRNSIPYKNPSDWEYYSPFKASDSLALTILKGASLSVVAALVGDIAYLIGWCLGCNGWVFTTWILSLFAIVVLFMEGRSVFVTMRWWWWYLTPDARTRLRQSWIRDGYSAF